MSKSKLLLIIVGLIASLSFPAQACTGVNAQEVKVLPADASATPVEEGSEAGAARAPVSNPFQGVPVTDSEEL